MIGVINFTHSDPLYAAIERKELVTRESPAKILEMILDGKLEGGMVSLVSLIRNGLSLSRGANIHSVSTTMSTLLVSEGRGMSDRMSIAVTSHTRTTEFYTEMVLKGMGIDYRLIHSKSTTAEDLLTEADYALVIGDEALKVYSTRLRILFDTGFEFARLYHLQPLYAAMAYPSGKEEPADMDNVNRAVFPSWDTVKDCIGRASDRLALSSEIMRRYYSLVRYDFTPSLTRTVEFVKRQLARQ